MQTLCSAPTATAAAPGPFLKTRRNERRTDEELVRFHVGRRLENRVAQSTLSVAQNVAAELVQVEQMQVAIDQACVLALALEVRP